MPEVQQEEEGKRDLKMVQDTIQVLRQRFDTVQIFCSRHESAGGTTMIHWGDGNYFARYGQAQLWLMRQDEKEMGDSDE